MWTLPSTAPWLLIALSALQQASTNPRADTPPKSEPAPANTSGEAPAEECLAARQAD